MLKIDDLRILVDVGNQYINIINVWFVVKVGIISIFSIQLLTYLKLAYSLSVSGIGSMREFLDFRWKRVVKIPL